MAGRHVVVVTDDKFLAPIPSQFDGVSEIVGDRFPVTRLPKKRIDRLNLVPTWKIMIGKFRTCSMNLRRQFMNG